MIIIVFTYTFSLPIQPSWLSASFKTPLTILLCCEFPPDNLHLSRLPAYFLNQPTIYIIHNLHCKAWGAQSAVPLQFRLKIERAIITFGNDSLLTEVNYMPPIFYKTRAICMAALCFPITIHSSIKWRETETEVILLSPRKILPLVLPGKGPIRTVVPEISWHQSRGNILDILPECSIYNKAY